MLCHSTVFLFVLSALAGAAVQRDVVATFEDEGVMLAHLRSRLIDKNRRVLTAIEGAVASITGDVPMYPDQVDGVNITAGMQELVPLIGACYWPVPELQDAVLLYRQRTPDAALASLDRVQQLQARHMAVNVGQMYDKFDVIDGNANEILRANPADPHALFVKALYAHAFNDSASYSSYFQKLSQASPNALVALDRAVNDVMLAWDPRSYPPYTPENLPKGWTPQKLAIVVFGCPVRDDGTPEPCLEERLNATLKLTTAFPEAQVLTSGGAVSTKYPEGAFIRQWLVDRGVASSRIFVDTAARDTLGNCIYVASWLRENHAGNVIIVTSTWHSPRARLNLMGLLEQYSLVKSVVSVGAGRASYPTQKELDDRLALELKASHRDAARARGLFAACDF